MGAGPATDGCLHAIFLNPILLYNIICKSREDVSLEDESRNLHEPCLFAFDLTVQEQLETQMSPNIFELFFFEKKIFLCCTKSIKITIRYSIAFHRIWLALLFHLWWTGTCSERLLAYRPPLCLQLAHLFTFIRPRQFSKTFCYRCTCSRSPQMAGN